MVIKKIKITLDKKDYLRGLLSDTLPFDTPIIFSNDGFYINSKRYDKNFSGDMEVINKVYQKIIDPLKETPPDISKKKKQSSPYKYKIIKDAYNFRELSLIHPRAQINYCEFYNKFSSVILHNASNSSFSIRRPVKVSSSFYINENDNDGMYKKSNITSTKKELTKKFSSSYYSYYGVNRLYKYFNSLNFYEHEKKFSTMWMLDVSHCFDSIYTHSVSWAIKGKDYIRSHLDYNSQFAQELDTLMQRSNNNETNGIPIGSEFSRIFSELIFQRIDTDIENEIKSKYKWNHNVDYKILRYVDDYILYSHNEEQALAITKIISLKLNNYNLHLNNQKLIKLQRPFCTKKTSIISKIDDLLQKLKDELLIEKNDIIYLNIDKKYNAYKNFINATKSICFENNSSYVEISSYIISSLCKITEKIIRHFNLEKIESTIDDLIKVKIKDTIFIISDLMIFYYSVYPFISSSYIITKAIILTDNYLGLISQDYQNIFRTKITHAAENLYMPNINVKNGTSENEPIEKLNLILSTTFFGDNYLIGSEAFYEMLHENKPDYFTITSCLFYFRNRHCYQKLKGILEKKTKEKLIKEMDLLQDSQQAHLFLDVLSCPFVTIKTRSEIYTAFLKKYYPQDIRLYADIIKDLKIFQSTYWFINWQSHDLLTMIEKKELKVTY